VTRCRSEFKPFLPSQIAAGALLWAINIHKELTEPSMVFWEEDLEKYSQYTKEDLKKVFASMKVIYEMMSPFEEEEDMSIRVESLI
jgi:hypothetical protein